MEKMTKLQSTVQKSITIEYKHPELLANIQKSLAPLLLNIANHPLFKAINNASHLRIFVEHHVFAVWDFMCLLKHLQNHITCVTVPWFPPLDALGGHLINEILTEEEGDITEDGRYLSHFELYLEAMEQLNANTTGIIRFLQKLKNGESVAKTINDDYIFSPSKNFVKATFIILEKKLHEVAAAFVFGREDITYKMFQPIVDTLEKTELSDTKILSYYLKRHIELDATQHASKGLKLLENLCGDDLIKWQEAEETAIDALEARCALLDGIYQAILNHKSNISDYD